MIFYFQCLPQHTQVWQDAMPKACHCCIPGGVAGMSKNQTQVSSHSVDNALIFEPTVVLSFILCFSHSMMTLRLFVVKRHVMTVDASGWSPGRGQRQRRKCSRTKAKMVSLACKKRTGAALEKAHHATESGRPALSTQYKQRPISVGNAFRGRTIIGPGSGGPTAASLSTTAKERLRSFQQENDSRAEQAQ